MYVYIGPTIFSVGELALLVCFPEIDATEGPTQPTPTVHLPNAAARALITAVA